MAGARTIPPTANAAPPAALVRARWYDGLNSQGRPVLIGFQPGTAGPALVLHQLHQGAAPVVFGHRQVGWPEAWHAQRLQERLVVDLQDAGSLEIEDAAGWHAALQRAGQRPTLAQRMQTRWPAFIAVLVVAAIGLTLFYRYGTPWAATQLTRFVPLAWETALTTDTLRRMDEGRMLKPSQLAPERQAALRQRFDALVAQTPPGLQRYRGYAPRYTLSFRSGMGPNAFALPGGAIVVTDDLVREARERQLGDDAIVGVLAHEIGHVVHRHTTRMLVEQGVLNIGLGLALGDVSGLLSTGSALLTGLAYSRSKEREADCFAIALMGQARLPTAPMADLLLAIAHDAETPAPTPAAGASTPASQAPPSPHPQPAQEGWTLLSSHPDTVQRARELRDGHAPHCAR